MPKMIHSAGGMGVDGRGGRRNSALLGFGFCCEPKVAVPQNPIKMGSEGRTEKDGREGVALVRSIANRDT